MIAILNTIKNKMRVKMTLFFKLLLMLGIVVMPLYAFGITITEWGKNIIRDKIENSMLAEAKYIINSFEKEIENIRLLQYENLTNNLEIRRLGLFYDSLDETQRIDLMLKISDYMSIVTRSNKYIKDAGIYYPTLRRSIYANKGIGLSEHEPYLHDNFNQVSNYDDLLIYKDNRIFLSLGYPNVLTKTHKIPIYIISIELSQEEIKKSLLLTSVHSSNSVMLMDLNEKWVLYNKVIVPMDKLRDAVIFNKTSESKVLYISKNKYIAAFKVSKLLNLALIIITREDILLSPIYEYRTIVLLFSLIALTVIIIFSIMIKRYIEQPILKIVHAFDTLQEGNFLISIQYKSNDEFKLLFEKFNTMVSKIRNLINEIYEQKILTQRMELKFLHSQIKPHFLNNSFFLLYSLAKTGNINMLSELTERLSSYYGFIAEGFKDMIPLVKEVKYAKTYAEIQEIHYYEKISVSFAEIPVSLEGFEVPKLIIQPLIENSFKHGLKNMEQDGLIIFEIFSDCGLLSMSVEDNGEELTDEKIKFINDTLLSDHEEMDSIGLMNIQKRIKNIFGTNSGVEASRSKLGGLKITIFIRLDKQLL